MKLGMILGLILVFLMPTALAVEENVGKCTDITGKNCKLLITDVDVKVDGKSSKNLDEGETIGEEAKPGSSVKFSIELFNNFTDDEDIEIEDIQVTVTIEEIDDGDEIEEESKEFDIDADDEETVDIEFEIPLEVEEDDFDVIITIEGDTDKNGSQEVEMKLTLEVKKESHEVIFLRNTLTPSEIKCGRTVQLSTNVINTGADKEDDVSLEVSNAELGVSLKEIFELGDDPFDEDSKFSKTFTFTVADDVLEGVYPILSKVTYNDGRTSKTETSDLTVRQCELSEEEEMENEMEEEREEEMEEESVVVVTPPQEDQGDLISGGVVTLPQLPPTEEESIFQSQTFLIALVAGEVLLVLIAILLVVAFVKKRRE